MFYKWILELNLKIKFFRKLQFLQIFRIFRFLWFFSIFVIFLFLRFWSDFYKKIDSVSLNSWFLSEGGMVNVTWTNTSTKAPWCWSCFARDRGGSERAKRRTGSPADRLIGFLSEKDFDLKTKNKTQKDLLLRTNFPWQRGSMGAKILKLKKILNSHPKN